MTGLQRTIALYCRDLKEELVDIPETAGLASGLDSVIDRALEEEYDQKIIRAFENLLGRYSDAILRMLSRYPQSGYLDRLYKRTTSIQDLCVNLLREE